MTHFSQISKNVSLLGTNFGRIVGKISRKFQKCVTWRFTYICQPIKCSKVFDRKKYGTNTCKNIENWVSICNKNEKGEVLNWNIINQYRWWCNAPSNLKISIILDWNDNKESDDFKCASSDSADLTWAVKITVITVIKNIKLFRFCLCICYLKIKSKVR